MEPLERLLVLTQKDSRTNNLNSLHPFAKASRTNRADPNPPTNGRRIRRPRAFYFGSSSALLLTFCTGGGDHFP